MILLGLLIASITSTSQPATVEETTYAYEETPVVIEEQVCDHQSTIDELNRQIAELQNQIANKDNTIADLNDTINNLEEQLTSQEETETIYTPVEIQTDDNEGSDGHLYVTRGHSDKYDAYIHAYKDCPFIDDKQEYVEEATSGDLYKTECKCIYSDIRNN